MKTLAIVVFILMYVGIVALPKWRFAVPLAASLIFIIAGVMPLSSVFPAVDWNVLMMICGTMLTVDYFIDSGMPKKMASGLMSFSKNAMWLVVLLSLFAGVISAFIDNVATVLMVAPVGLALCAELGISPVAMLISISVSSNLQGAATLVGDATSIMLGAHAGMDFNEFFFMNGKPGIFFAVELGALATVPVMMLLFRKYRKIEIPKSEKVTVKDYIPTAFLLLQIISLIAASFIPGKPAVTNGLICIGWGVACMVVELIRTRDKAPFINCLKNIDYKTLLLLFGLFIAIGSIEKAGIIDDIAAGITKIGGGNAFLLYTIIVWGSVFISAFIDNIPYVATMLPVISIISSTGTMPANALYFGLLCGATLGGNISPFGASANVAAVGMLEKAGHRVKIRDFIKIGVPFTLVAVTVSYLFIWPIWGAN